MKQGDNRIGSDRPSVNALTAEPFDQWVFVAKAVRSGQSPFNCKNKIASFLCMSECCSFALVSQCNLKRGLVSTRIKQVT